MQRNGISTRDVIEGKRNKIQAAWRRFRLRQDGVSTLSTLLSESRTENRLLKEKTHELEQTIQELTIKINSNQRGVGTDMSAHVQEYLPDVFLPPASKSLMESIIRENSDLKRAAELQSDPQLVDELYKRISALQSLCETLRRDKDRLEAENGELSHIIESTGTDSQRREYELNKRLRQTEENSRCNHNMCRDYMQQINFLKERLADTARQCLDVRNSLPPITCAPETTCYSPPITTLSHNNQPITVQASSPLQVPESIPTTSDDAADKDSVKPVSFEEPTAQPSGQPSAQPSAQHSTRYRQFQKPDSRTQQRQSDDQTDTRSQQSRARAESNIINHLAEENRRLKDMLLEKRHEVDKLKDHQLFLQNQLEVYRENFKSEKLQKENTSARVNTLQNELEQYKNKISSQQRRMAPGPLNAWDKHPASSPNVTRAAHNSSSDQSTRRKETVTSPKQSSGAHKPAEKTPRKPTAGDG